MNDLAKKLSEEFVRPNQELDFLIKHNTESYRKGFGKIALVYENGEPFHGEACVNLKQVSHEYKFGANLFMLDSFPEKEKNAAFEEKFKEIFNLGVVPFYWSDLEPERGKPRFSKNSAPIPRRPPPDLVVEYCEKNGITPKGHPLCWNQWLPEWLPKSPDQWLDCLERRFAEISERYASRIPVFDVVNEPHSALLHYNTPLPENIVEIAFKMADKYFPRAQLILNDDKWWWKYHRELSPVFMLAEKIQKKGLNLGGLGFQYHMFHRYFDDEYRFFMNPRHLYKCLDLYHNLRIPCNLSEISILGSDELGDGDAFQNLIAEKLYRLWFSHPATDGIVWWNLVDYTAYVPIGGETCYANSLRSGLLNYDLSPKPSFNTLRELIKNEWRTDASINYSEKTENRFHGFFGDYEVEIKTNAGIFRDKATHAKRIVDEIKITLPMES